MTINEKTAEILNDLVEINNDRVRGYEKASKETEAKDADLRSIFDELATESRRYSNELGQYVRQSGEKPAEGTTVVVKPWHLPTVRDPGQAPLFRHHWNGKR